MSKRAALAFITLLLVAGCDGETPTDDRIGRLVVSGTVDSDGTGVPGARVVLSVLLPIGEADTVGDCLGRFHDTPTVLWTDQAGYFQRHLTSGPVAYRACVDVEAEGPDGSSGRVSGVFGTFGHPGDSLFLDIELGAEPVQE